MRQSLNIALQIHWIRWHVKDSNQVYEFRLCNISFFSSLSIIIEYIIDTSSDIRIAWISRFLGWTGHKLQPFFGTYTFFKCSVCSINPWVLTVDSLRRYVRVLRYLEIRQRFLVDNILSASRIKLSIDVEVINIIFSSIFQLINQ